MIRRHPHVFGDVHIENDQQVKQQWQQIKNREKAENKDASLLNNIPAGLPAVMRALAMSQKAARVGFDWPDVRGVVDKMEEEWAEFKDELKAAPAHSGNRAGLMEEIGDLMFTLVNLARLLDIHPESALARTNAKFQNRFGQMEDLAHGQGETLENMDFGGNGPIVGQGKSHGKKQFHPKPRDPSLADITHYPEITHLNVLEEES